MKADGFTLLEIMVAISILAVVMTGVFKIHAQSVFMADRTKFYAAAPLLAHQKLAEIDSAPDKKRIRRLHSGQFPDNFSQYRWSVVVAKTDLHGEGNVFEDLKKIDIKISTDRHEHFYLLRAYRFWRF